MSVIDPRFTPFTGAAASPIRPGQIVESYRWTPSVTGTTVVGPSKTFPVVSAEIDIPSEDYEIRFTGFVSCNNENNVDETPEMGVTMGESSTGVAGSFDDVFSSYGSTNQGFDRSFSIPVNYRRRYSSAQKVFFLLKLFGVTAPIRINNDSVNPAASQISIDLVYMPASLVTTVVSDFLQQSTRPA